MNPDTSSKRLAFPTDEPVHPWLSRLLEAYHITDTGVGEGIRRTQAQGRKLACGRGCAACCRSHQDIPVYPLELIGISWYVTEKVSGPVREQLRERLLDSRNQQGCPFLVDEVCSIHAMRPMACRQFNVFDTVCSAGEDAWHTRRQDVLTPLKQYTDQAFDVMLPFYGIEKKSERRKAIRAGTIHRIARVLKECNWSSLAEKMAHHDNRKAGNS